MMFFHEVHELVKVEIGHGEREGVNMEGREERERERERGNKRTSMA